MGVRLMCFMKIQKLLLKSTSFFVGNIIFLHISLRDCNKERFGVANPCQLKIRQSKTIISKLIGSDLRACFLL